MRKRQKPDPPSKQELTDRLIPIGKRMPAYIRLGWAVAREPSIPWIHRSGLYATVIYIVSPAHLVVSAIPVLGQVDVIGMLLLSLRQALKHCPQQTLTRLCARVKLPTGQLSQDIQTILQLTRRGTFAVSYSVREKFNEKAPGMAAAGRSVVFAGKIASGFTRRVTKRLRHNPTS